MIHLWTSLYLGVAAVSVPFWPASHRRHWTIILKAVSWPFWGGLFYVIFPIVHYLQSL